MSIRIQHTGIDPFEDHLDGLLAKIAFILQLPPSLHEKATDRYKAVREYLEGTTAFRDQIEHFYAQGSMAIDATISTRGTEDEYDIDIVAQLGGRFLSMSPLEILKELERSLNGYRGMRAIRQTRCVTLGYADNMHLDITPGLRDSGTPDRQSRIMHAKGPNASADDDEIPMNAYGFAEWYKDRTPFELRVHDAFKRRWQDAGILSTRADAEVDEVDEQADFVVKNTATLALQLLKRYRNIMYAGRSGRIPPSVMLAYYAGLMATPGLRLSDMLIRVCEAIVHDIEVAEARGILLHVENPCYREDVFTDRWPADRSQQVRFAKDLQSLLEGLRRARKGLLMPDALRDWLRETFGDLVVTEAVRRLSEATGKSVREGLQSYTRTGALILPTATGSTPAMASPVSATKHTFFGKIVK
jgi:hypothetical protein